MEITLHKKYYKKHPVDMSYFENFYGGSFDDEFNTGYEFALWFYYELLPDALWHNSDLCELEVKDKDEFIDELTEWWEGRSAAK